MPKYRMHGQEYASLEALVRDAKLETLHHWLRSHDWAYRASDDFRAFNAGDNEWRNIKALADDLGEAGRLIVQHYETQGRPRR